MPEEEPSVSKDRIEPRPRDPAARVYQEPTLRVNKEPSVSEDHIEPPSRDYFRLFGVSEHFFTGGNIEPRANITGPSSLPEQSFTQQNNFDTRHQRYNVKFADNYVPENLLPSLKPSDGSSSPPLLLPSISSVVPWETERLSRFSGTDVPALSSTLNAQPEATQIPQDRSDREPSIERCVGCNEAWRRPIPDMDQDPLAPPVNNADYMRIASNMIDRLREQRKRADAAYEEWKWRHSHCYRPVSPKSTGASQDIVIQSGLLPDSTPKKRRAESPHERHIASKQSRTTGSLSAEPLVSQLEQAASTDDCSPSSYDPEHMEGVTLSPFEEISTETGQSRCRCLSMTDAGSPDAETRHWLSESDAVSSESWESFRETLPESCKWDIEYHATTGTNQHSRGCWTYASSDNGVMSNIPLTIANVPVVLPVQYRWPPVGAVHPPPDPRPFLPIDCRAELSMEVIQDILLTFEGSIGFYLLINGLLQVLVPATFDTAWASSHLPHKFGGLRVCYVEKSLEKTMTPSQVQTSRSRSPLSPLSSFFRPSRSAQPLQINDLIEARAGSSTREKFSGRVGMKVVSRQGEPLLLMSSHVITAAILGKSFLGTNWNPLKRLQDDWNDHADIWARGAKIGRIAKSYDKNAEIYPNGFNHDITLIRSTNPTAIEGVTSPVQGLGWLSKDAWSSLRTQNSFLKILGTTEAHRDVKCIKCNLQSEAMIVGEGIFLNQIAAAGSTSLRDNDELTWRKMVSRAVLYRLSPDFDPPEGYSGIALYAENGKREDGSTGPGVVGMQSFVQRSMFAQTFNMPQNATMERHLRQGRIAFYGAFQVPDDLRANYTIV
ncbi:hypothetical protein B5807_10528 [Epicoccum nigrum]|uniref:Uncharacterized protein n=1 Tax=Epicoccum nigrum TaxID=105696 RepID=A0A1Y2LLU6_EPING|nr:hypothetical protein B5807_10528 [Epicoccum nigrum]